MWEKLMGNKHEERHKHHSRRRGLMEKFHKIVFLVGMAVAFKGLKGWMRDKKRKMMH